ncbi:MAG: succinate-semialdehyde dehydrogenase (NADP(+)), partial [Marinobacter sp.]|nr:succinate-semialdehyde dehydrogenase (NADP(+)) [Marinobacter sp.]
MSLELKNRELLREQAYINGQWITAKSGKTFAVTDPASGEQLATVPDMDDTDARAAIEAASAAWPAWRSTPAKERANILRKWFNLLMANQEDLARLMTAEQGKPLAESRGEVGYGASFIEWFAEEAKRAYGDVIPGHGKDKRIV